MGSISENKRIGGFLGMARSTAIETEQHMNALESCPVVMQNPSTSYPVEVEELRSGSVSPSG